MTEQLPSMSTDQIAAFVELARSGSIRAAAASLHITEQGLRNRILSLEDKLGAELYRKRRGVKRSTQITEAGSRFLPRALAFLEQARELAATFSGTKEVHEIHIAASHYLTLYVLIEAVRRFHRDYPDINVRVSTMNEQEIEEAILSDPRVALGVAAPYEPSPELDYRRLFSLEWSLITPRAHPLLAQASIRLHDLAGEPLILFESGSSGRQHVLEAFLERGLTPEITTEATSTEVIVRMVEAGLGLSIVPLMPDGSITRGRKVGIRKLRPRIRAIQSGILSRKGAQLSPAAELFRTFVLGYELPR